MATKTKTKLKFNAFDFVIIILVVLCIAAVVLKSTFIKNTEYSNYIKVNFKIENVESYLVAELMHAGTEQTIYLFETDENIGSIYNLSSSPSSQFVEDTKVYNPTLYTITGEATLKGVFKDSGFLINGNIDSLIGTKIDVFTKQVTFTLVITSLV